MPEIHNHPDSPSLPRQDDTFPVNGGGDRFPAWRPVAWRLVRSLRFWFASAVVLFCLAAAYWILQNDLLVQARTALGPFAPLITVPIHIVVSLTPFPSDVITIANGAIYGFVLGASLSWIGWWLAALIAFAIGRLLATEVDFDEQMAKMPDWIRRFPVGHPVFLIFGRQIPWAGGHLTTWLPGALGVPFRRFLWCSAIAVIPGAITLSGVGAGIRWLY